VEEVLHIRVCNHVSENTVKKGDSYLEDGAGWYGVGLGAWPV